MTRLDPPAVAGGCLEEADVEADVVADEQRVAGPVEELLGGLLRAGSVLDFGVIDAVQLTADDGRARVDEGRPAVLDLAVVYLDGADLDQRALLDVATGRLDIEDHEWAIALERVDECQHRAHAGLDVGQALGLANLLAQLLLELDDGRQRAMAEHDRLGHDRFGHDLGTRLDHHDRVARTGDDEVDVRRLELRDRRVEHELAVDAAHSHSRNRAVERDLADRQRSRGGDRADDVGIVLLVGREDRQDDLDVVLVALGEERPNGSVGQPGGQDGRLRGARLALDEAARDLARGVHPLFEVDGQRKEVQAWPRLGAIGRAEQHRVAVADRDRAAGERGHLARLDSESATGDLGRKRCD